MEASKLTIGQKTYDLNYLTKTKKTNLRRKLIIEYIESKPAGTLIKIGEFQELARFKSYQNTHQFINRMVRDGVISRYEGNRPKTYYFAVTGSIRQKKPAETTENQLTVEPKNDKVIELAKELKKLGLKFTITINNGE